MPSLESAFFTELGYEYAPDLSLEDPADISHLVYAILRVMRGLVSHPMPAGLLTADDDRGRTVFPLEIPASFRALLLPQISAALDDLAGSLVPESELDNDPNCGPSPLVASTGPASDDGGDQMDGDESAASSQAVTGPGLDADHLDAPSVVAAPSDYFGVASAFPCVELLEQQLFFGSGLTTVVPFYLLSATLASSQPTASFLHSLYAALPDSARPLDDLSLAARVAAARAAFTAATGLAPGFDLASGEVIVPFSVDLAPPKEVPTLLAVFSSALSACIRFHNAGALQTGAPVLQAVRIVPFSSLRQPIAPIVAGALTRALTAENALIDDIARVLRPGLVYPPGAEDDPLGIQLMSSLYDAWNEGPRGRPETMPPLSEAQRADIATLLVTDCRHVSLGDGPAAEMVRGLLQKQQYVCAEAMRLILPADK
jgi:hypothetical protein